ncbi:MAG: KTSC domain-containing protein [Bacteroidota bacterium]
MKGVIEEKIHVKSSIIEYFVYNYETRDLRVQYRKGKQRSYSDIPESDLKEILAARSVGKTFLKYLDRNQKRGSKRSVIASSQDKPTVWQRVTRLLKFS